MLGVEAALTLVHPGPDAELPPGPVTMQASAYRTTATVRSARYRVDDGPWRPLRGSGDWTWAADHDFRGTASGPHEWQVQVEDDAGRSWERSSSFTIVPELSPAVPMAGAAWPMFHGDPARSGASTDAVSPPLRLAWSHRSDGSILTGSPVVAGTTVYVGVRDEDGDDRCGLAAVDLATGSRRWWSPARSMVDATPAVAGDLVHTTSVDGMLQAHDTRTGQPVWEHRADDDDALAYVSAYGSLAVADGVVLSGYRTYRHDGGRQASVISARDALTGAERWSFTSAFFYQVNDHKAVAVGGGRVYVNPGLNPPWGIDLQSGARTWSARLTLPAGDRPLEFGQGPVVVTDSLVLTTYRDSVSKGPNAVVAFDVGSGDEVWRYLGPAEVLAFSDLDGTAPAVSGDTVYAALASGAVVALDLATGAERWRRDLGTALLSSPAVSGTTIYVGGNDGVLYALDSSAGDVTWSYQLGSWVASSPAVSGNTVVVGAWDGNLYAFVGEPA